MLVEHKDTFRGKAASTQGFAMEKNSAALQEVDVAYFDLVQYVARCIFQHVPDGHEVTIDVRFPTAS